MAVLSRLALFDLIIGAIIIVGALISAGAMALTITKGIQTHTYDVLRVYVDRIVLDILVPLVGGIALVFTGYRMIKTAEHSITIDRKKEIRNSTSITRNRVIDTVLSNDEKRIFNLIKESKGGALQSDIVVYTGFSKVKVHRILKSLENKELIRRGRFGITNKVMLKK
jgi:uncharacterized membrane protein